MPGQLPQPPKGTPTGFRLSAMLTVLGRLLIPARHRNRLRALRPGSEARPRSLRCDPKPGG